MSTKAQQANAQDELHIVAQFTDGGHEIDRPPSATLFVFLAVMAVLIVASTIGVFQLFVNEADKEAKTTLSQPIALQANQAARDQSFYATYGVITVEGQPAGYRMPITAAKALVLANPARFAPAPAPEGWVHPDDVNAPKPPPDKK